MHQNVFVPTEDKFLRAGPCCDTLNNTNVTSNVTFLALLSYLLGNMFLCGQGGRCSKDWVHGEVKSGRTAGQTCILQNLFLS